MSKEERKRKILELQLAKHGWVAHLINRGEQVKYFDGSRYIEGEVTWSWSEPTAPGGLPRAVPPLHIDAGSLYVANPPELRGALSQEEKMVIAERIKMAFREQGTDAVVVSASG